MNVDTSNERIQERAAFYRKFGAVGEAAADELLALVAERDELRVDLQQLFHRDKAARAALADRDAAYDRGASEMRERAAAACNSRAQASCNSRQYAAETEAIECAADIRALPLRSAP